ncbi:hypothetical protein HDU97_001259 [Phlyctochytrium planicorne]|nr:hypothetical protein HDU97_001259 [Phlyctochytrium planicorne]
MKLSVGNTEPSAPIGAKDQDMQPSTSSNSTSAAATLLAATLSPETALEQPHSAPPMQQITSGRLTTSSDGRPNSLRASTEFLASSSGSDSGGVRVTNSHNVEGGEEEEEDMYDDEEEYEPMPAVPKGHPGLPKYYDMNWFNRSVREHNRRASILTNGTTAMSFGNTSFWTGKSTARRLDLTRMGKSKIVYVVVNGLYTFASIAAIILISFTWTDFYPVAPLFRILSRTVLILSTATAGMIFVNGVLGFVGAFLHHKPLIVASIILGLVAIVVDIVTGYLAYRFVHHVHWDEMLWTEWDNYPRHDRITIESKLACCGYLSAMDRPEAYFNVGPAQPPAATSPVVVPQNSPTLAAVPSSTALIPSGTSVVSLAVSSQPGSEIATESPAQPSPTSTPTDGGVSVDQPNNQVGGIRYGWFPFRYSSSIVQRRWEMGQYSSGQHHYASLTGSGGEGTVVHPMCRLDPSAGGQHGPISTTTATSSNSPATTTVAPATVASPSPAVPTTTDDIFNGLDRRDLRRRQEDPLDPPADPNPTSSPAAAPQPSPSPSPSPADPANPPSPTQPPAGIADPSQNTTKPVRTLPAAPPPPILNSDGTSPGQSSQSVSQSSIEVGNNDDLLPGCVGAYSEFARSSMRAIFYVAFSFIPLALMQFVTGILVANHIYD